MKLVGGAVGLLVAGYLIQSYWLGRSGAQTRPQAQQRVVQVETAVAQRKKLPVRLDALGTVTPIASVAIKTRLDTAITEVHFRDGERVEKGQLLFTLDCRTVDAQVSQTEGNVARSKAQLAGAERDVTRYTDLVGRNATPIVNLDNAKTQADVFRASITSDQGVLDNLKVQQSFCKITAPISGRISAAAVKVGNLVRQADVTPMATIIQTAPVYVTFTLPQAQVPALRQSIANETGAVEAGVTGSATRSQGAITMLENTIDQTTGMVTARATMPNADEFLWPGTLVNVSLTLREEEDVVVPTSAVQVSQAGQFVFVIKDNKAVVQPIKVSRTVGREAAIESGLKADDVVVVDGQLQLTNGVAVQIKDKKAGA